jgi:hypothetical protein
MRSVQNMESGTKVAYEENDLLRAYFAYCMKSVNAEKNEMPPHKY